MFNSDSRGDITDLLHQVAAGSKDAEAELIPRVYDQLKRIAGNYMRREGRDQTMQTTALVHEAYLRLTRSEGTAWNNRAHFFAVAATVMRHILVDHARARQAERRGGGLVFISEAPDQADRSAGDPVQLLALDDALTRLAALDARQSRIVELRFFAGMTVSEIAETLDLSVRTVKRDWQIAKAWLYGELTS